MRTGVQKLRSVFKEGSPDSTSSSPIES
jgi:hypothetical protein